MKTNAIVRIVLFSLAILILAGILVTALSVDLFMFRDGLVSTGSTTLPIANHDVTNTCVADSSEIQNIEIEWVAGNIEIIPDPNVSLITVAETNNGKDKYNMICSTVGDTLKIQFCEDSINFPSFGINVDISKDLLIVVPENWSCGTLEVDAASASMNVTGMTIQEVDFDGASGICVFENCYVDSLDLDTASGDVNFSGTLNVLRCDAVSANFHGVFEQTPSALNFDGISGDMDLTFPEDCGFTVALNSLSDNFECDFPTTLSGGNHIYGDGSCRIEADGVSGSITIRNGGSVGTNTGTSSNSNYCTAPNCTDSSHHHSENHH